MTDFQLEHDLNRYAGSHPVVDWLARHVAESQLEVVAALLLIVAAGLLLRRRNLALDGGLAILGAAAGLLGNVVVSHIWTRPRPFVSHPTLVNVIVHHPADSSFPSDHSAALAAIATVFALRKERAAAIVFSCWAVLVGVARVYVGEHYPGDIVGGWAVGVLCGGAVAFVARAGKRRLRLMSERSDSCDSSGGGRRAAVRAATDD